ncbi:MAG: hypothetical protein ACLFRX_11410 [Gemmatimonadota bacterium]
MRGHRRARALADHAMVLAGGCAAALATAVLPAAAPAAAQELGLEGALRLASSYEARGKTYHEGPAAQVMADVVASWAGGEVRAGAWVNGELWQAEQGATMLAGAAPGMSEVNLYVSTARRAGPVTVTGGWIYFLWPTGFDFSDASAVHELYVGASAPLPAALGRAGAAASATAYYDFSARGTYAVVTVGAPLAEAWSLRPELGLEVAGIVSQEEYYARADGLTHVGVKLSAAAAGRWTVIRPELRWTIGLDEAARVGAVREDCRHKLHLGLSFSR